MSGDLDASMQSPVTSPESHRQCVEPRMLMGVVDGGPDCFPEVTWGLGLKVTEKWSINTPYYCVVLMVAPKR